MPPRNQRKPPEPVRHPWTPDDIRRLIVVVISNLCMLIIVSSAMLGIAFGTLNPAQLGSVTSAGVGTGILGLAGIVYAVIKGQFPKGPSIKES